MKGATIAILVGLAVAIVLLAVVFFLLWRSRKKQAAAQPPEPKLRPLKDVLAAFLRALPRQGRGLPIVLVLGERLSGKSSMIAAGLARGGLDPALIPGDTADPRLGIYTGRGLLVLELAGEILDDDRAEARAGLVGFLRPIALRIALVVLAINASAPSYTSQGLRRIGTSARAVIDLLTAVRGRRSRLRLCLTHLDERMDGFTELVQLAGENRQAPVPLAPAGRIASGPQALLASLDPFLAPLLGSQPLATVARMARSLSGGADQVWATLEHCVGPLLGLGRSRRQPPPWFEGLALAGLAPGNADAMFGDPFSLDTPGTVADVRAHEGRRLVRTLAVAAAASAMLAIPYAWHLLQVSRAPAAVDDFVKLGGASPDKVDRAEQRAGSLLRSSLLPFWPPLGLAYPARKQRVKVEPFLEAVRARYLLPKLADPSATVRLYDVALLRAYDGSDLGALVLKQKAVFASKLGLSEAAVEDYVRLSFARWDGAISLPAEEATGTKHGLRECQSLLSDDRLSRPEIDLTTLVELQKCTRQAIPTSDASADVLHALAPEDARMFLAQAGSVTGEPRASSSTVQPLIAAVEHANLRVPSPVGKSLREALDDLAAMPCRKHDEVAKPATIPAETLQPAAPDPATIIASSRSSYYLTALLQDLRARKKPHALFFADREFDAVGTHDMPGRGAQAPLPGQYTAAAVESEIAAALPRLDAVLDSACVPQEQQKSLRELVRKEMKSYAGAYKAALGGYLASFTLASDSLASLQKDLQDMVAAGSWFDLFWSTLAQNAAVDTHNDANLEILARELAGFAPVAALVPAKGKPIKLDKYYEIFKEIPASLEQTGLAEAEGKLGDRLDPLGKLGLKLLDPGAPQPLSQVKKWLAASSLSQDDMRRPFLLPAKAIYDWAIADVSHAVGTIYTQELRPVVEPLWQQFPFAIDATADADPAELCRILGPGGSLRGAFRDGIEPVLTKRSGGYEAKSAADFGPVRVAKEIRALGGWLDDVNAFLFDEAGKPKPIAFSVQPALLAKVEPRSTRVLSRSYLAVGDLRVEGFNQAPSRKALPVSWIDSPPALVGVEITDSATGMVSEDRRDGSGEAWPFLRLLHDAARPQSDTFEWELAGVVRFQVRPDPWDKLLPPDGHRLRASRYVGPPLGDETLGAWIAP